MFPVYNSPLLSFKVALSRGQLYKLLSNDGGSSRNPRLAAGLFTCWAQPEHETGARARVARAP